MEENTSRADGEQSAFSVAVKGAVASVEMTGS